MESSLNPSSIVSAKLTERLSNHLDIVLGNQQIVIAFNAIDVPCFRWTTVI
jgi:hypothetical protein